MKLQWMTWELFEETFKLPARSFPERCNIKKRLICVNNMCALKRQKKNEKR